MGGRAEPGLPERLLAGINADAEDATLGSSSKCWFGKLAAPDIQVLTGRPGNTEGDADAEAPAEAQELWGKRLNSFAVPKSSGLRWVANAEAIVMRGVQI